MENYLSSVVSICRIAYKIREITGFVIKVEIEFIEFQNH